MWESWGARWEEVTMNEVRQVRWRGRMAPSLSTCCRTQSPPSTDPAALRSLLGSSPLAAGPQLTEDWEQGLWVGAGKEEQRTLRVPK